jgi:hypothetical protein
MNISVHEAEVQTTLRSMHFFHNAKIVFLCQYVVPSAPSITCQLARLTQATLQFSFLNLHVSHPPPCGMSCTHTSQRHAVGKQPKTAQGSSGGARHASHGTRPAEFLVRKAPQLNTNLASFCRYWVLQINSTVVKTREGSLCVGFKHLTSKPIQHANYSTHPKK